MGDCGIYAHGVSTLKQRTNWHPWAFRCRPGRQTGQGAPRVCSEDDVPPPQTPSESLPPPPHEIVEVEDAEETAQDEPTGTAEAQVLEQQDDVEFTAYSKHDSAAPLQNRKGLSGKTANASAT